jgi:hypothetical protein
MPPREGWSLRISPREGWSLRIPPREGWYLRMPPREGSLSDGRSPRKKRSRERWSPTTSPREVSDGMPPRGDGILVSTSTREGWSYNEGRMVTSDDGM